MPYINKSRRQGIDMGEMPKTVGELNYKITKLILDYLEEREKTKVKNYECYNEIIGVLSCITQEFYRREVSKYENIKISQNGDIF